MSAEDDRDPLECLAEEYFERLRRGEAPTVEEYAARHPALAEEIRAILPAMVEMDRLAGLPGARFGEQPAVLVGAPARVGPYRVLREMGRGGMGVVYLAEDERLGRRVALKVLGPEIAASGAFQRRFAREAAVAARLDHPGICTVYDAGTADGVDYIAMRYLEGETLAQRLERRRTAGEDGTGSRESLDADLLLLEKAARAVHVAHEAGLIHRDVKPGNLMITPGGEPVVLDFGLARCEEEAEARFTGSATRLGTPAYMSPEQVAAENVRLDCRTDIYSLGVTLYEALTLHLPFEAPTLEGLYRLILSTDPEDPRRRNRHLPSDLVVVLETAMAKERERRYATALDLAEDLRRVRAGEPIRAKAVGPIGRLLRWARREPALASISAGLLLSLAGGLAVALGLLHEARRARDAKATALGDRNRALEARGLALEDSRRARAMAERARIEAESDRDAKAVALRRARAQALVGASTQSRRVDPMRALLLAREAVRIDPVPEAVSRLHEALCESRERMRTSTMLPPDMLLPGISIDISRDGQQILVHAWGSPLTAMFNRWGGLLTSFEIPASGPRVGVVVFGPRDETVLGESGEGVHVWQSDGKFLRTIPGARLGVSAPFSPHPVDSDRLLRVDAEAGTIGVVAIDGKEVASLVVNDISRTAVTLSPDGNRVVAGQGPRGALLWSVGDPTARVIDGHSDRVILAGFSPGGEVAWTASLDGSIHLWNMEGTLLGTVKVEGTFFTQVAFFPDGRSFLANCPGKGIRRWGVDGSELARFETASRHTYQDLRTPIWMAVSPHGTRVLTAEPDGAAVLWDSLGRELAIIGGTEASSSIGFHANRAVFTPDGAAVLLPRGDGTLGTFDVRGGEVSAVDGEGSTEPVIELVRDDSARRVELRIHTPTVMPWDYTRDARAFLLLPGDGSVRVMDPDGKVLGVLWRTDRRPWEKATFLGDGETLVAWCRGAVGILDRRGKPVAQVETDANERFLSLTPTWAGFLLLREDGRVRRFDSRGAEVASFELRTPRCDVVGAANDGRLAIPVFDEQEKRVRLEFRDSSGTLLHEACFESPAKMPLSLAVAPEGDRFAVSTMDGAVTIWGFDGRRVAEHRDQGRRDVIPYILLGHAVAFSPDGSRLLRAQGADPVILMDMEGRQVIDYPASDGGVTSVAFSPDGRRVATGGMDGTVILSDLGGTMQATLRGHRQSITGLQFLDNGRSLVTTSIDQTAKLWRIEVEDLLRLADQRCTRDFTPEEFRRYGDLLDRR